MSIRARILALVAFFVILALTVTTMGLLTLGDYERMMQAYSRASENAWRGERLNHLISNTVMESRGLYLAHDRNEMTAFSASLDQNLDNVHALMSQWEAVSPQEKQRLEPLEAEAATFIALRRQVAALGAQGKQKEAEALGLSNRTDRIAFQGEIEAMVSKTRSELDTARQETMHYGEQRYRDFLIAALIDIVLMLGLSLWIITHFITKPLRSLAAAIIRTSRGDYTAPLPQSVGSGEVASVWEALAVLKTRAIEAEKAAAAQREAERQQERELRQILLD